MDDKADRLYEQHAKPSEAEHWGEYIAISPDGQIVLGHNLTEVAQEAVSTFGRGVFLFKVGEKVAGGWR
ncbi:MAG: hypothetical protein EXR50_01140 [Dehalococcoidia bacterium]|nr:hypothetical protein [Dehalococcoidia bacterium]